MFSQHNLKAGDTLLVVGASGGVGHMATTVAHKKGIHVTGICGSRNEKFVKDLGAEKVICYDRDNIMGSLKERLSSDSHNGKMFDMCLDTVTSNEARDRASDYYTMIQEPRNLV
jgi:NADPH:quinone reductase-like Zn-dependent oxidoreductase